MSKYADNIKSNSAVTMWFNSRDGDITERVIEFYGYNPDVEVVRETIRVLGDGNLLWILVYKLNF